MSKLLVIREYALSQLVDSLSNNLEKYKQASPYADAFFEGKIWTAPSKIDDLPDNLLALPLAGVDNDLENSLRFYNALHGLTLTQATDPRLWTYLAHTKYWSYMRARWPIERSARGGDIQKAKGTVVDRYFLTGDRSRGVTRHGLARLWWAGYTCHVQSDDAERTFELAKPLFSKQDVFASFMERAFSKNKHLMQALLRALLKRHEAGTPFDNRDDVRSLAKHMVLIGGVTILDAIDSDRISKIVDAFIHDLAIANQGALPRQ